MESSSQKRLQKVNNHTWNHQRVCLRHYIPTIHDQIILDYIPMKNHEKSWNIMKKTILDLYKSVYGLWPTPSPPSPAALKSALLPRPALETTLPRPLETCHCPWEYPAPGMGRMLGVRYHKGWSNGWQQREALTTNGHYVNSHMLIVLIVIYENSSLFVQQVTLQILINQI